MDLRPMLLGRPVAWAVYRRWRATEVWHTTGRRHMPTADRKAEAGRPGRETSSQVAADRCAGLKATHRAKATGRLR